MSRAAVHKRLKEGRLTGFSFHVTRVETTLFGRKRKAKQRPYLVLSISECRAWAEELKRKAGLEGPVLHCNSVGAGPQREALRRVADEARREEVKEVDDFVEIDPKDRGNKEVIYSKDTMTREDLLDYVRFEIEAAFEALLPKKLHKKLVDARMKRGAAAKEKWLAELAASIEKEKEEQ